MEKKHYAWPESWPRTQNYPKRSIYYNLEQTVNRVPERIALIFKGMELTYQELKMLADRFASALVNLGLQKGDRVALHLINCPQFAIAYFGMIKIGAVFTPLSPMLTPDEAESQLNDCGAKVLVSLDLLYPGISSIIPKTQVKTIITSSIVDCFTPITQILSPLKRNDISDTLDMLQLLRDNEPHTDTVEIDVDSDLAHLAYTGGTTGRSKGVMLTHANVIANVIQNGNTSSGGGILEEAEDGTWIRRFPENADLQVMPLIPDKETVIAIAPWFHALGVIFFLNSPVFQGSTMVVLPRFDSKEFMDCIVKYQVTYIGGSPQLYIPLINHPDFDAYDLTSIKYAGSGAAPLGTSLIQKLTDKFSIQCINEGYGLTECTGQATMNPQNGAKAGSVGLPIFDTAIKVIDIQSREELPANEAGEICIQGPQVMNGYYNNPEATAAVLKDGWLSTGDIGLIDDDGYLFITDRLKDMIIYKGYNVYPRELEEKIFKHPAVEDCAVVGKQDQNAGEIPVAFVKLIQGAEITNQELIDFVNTQVAAYKKIREVHIVGSLPVSGVGKILKRDLRNQLSSTD